MLFLISFGLVSTVVCTLMFVLKRENWRTALFLTAVLIGLLLTILNATAQPSNLRYKAILSWLSFVPAALGVLLYFKPQRRILASWLAVATIVLGMFGVFI